MNARRIRTAPALAAAAFVTGLLAAMLPAPASAAGPVLWRCGADGRIFTDRPCAEGQPLARAAGPTPQAAAEAQAVTAREREAALRLAAERRARHAAALHERPGPAAIRPATPESTRVREPSAQPTPPKPPKPPKASKPQPRPGYTARAPG
jgi:hypothetical protein